MISVRPSGRGWLSSSPAKQNARFQHRAAREHDRAMARFNCDNLILHFINKSGINTEGLQHNKKLVKMSLHSPDDSFSALWLSAAVEPHRPAGGAESQYWNKSNRSEVSSVASIARQVVRYSVSYLVAWAMYRGCIVFDCRAKLNKVISLLWYQSSRLCSAF